MLKLYHGMPAANSLKCLIPLKEKDLPFESVFLDLMNFEQHEPWFVALNPEGQVPVLDHDGVIITHTSVINEYLEDVFPGTLELRPRDAALCAKMRYWNKYIDEHFMESVSIHGWKFMVTEFSRKIEPARFEALIARIPTARQRDKWRAARAGFADADLAKATGKVEETLEKVEAQLAGTEWLAGDSYSLADVNFFSVGGAGLDRLFPQIASRERFPRLFTWVDRIASRPAVQAAMAMRARPAAA